MMVLDYKLNKPAINAISTQIELVADNGISFTPHMSMSVLCFLCCSFPHGREPQKTKQSFCVL